MITTGRLRAVINQHWGALAAGERPPDRLSFLLLTKGREPVGKIVVLTFVAGEAAPRFIIKLARLKEHNPAIQAEYLNLRLISAHGNHGRVRTPEPLLCWEDDGRVCLVESVVDGVDLWNANSRVRSVAFVDPVVDWLIHLGRLPLGRRTEHTVDAIADMVAHAARHVRSEAERCQLEAITRHLEGRPADCLPHVFEHDDMGTWNVTVSRAGTIGILDWESTRYDGFPAADLFFFLAHYGFMMHATRTQADRLESFAETFFRHGSFARVAMSAVRRYTAALGVPRPWLLPLFLTCWLQHATAEVTRVGTPLSDSLFWQMLAVTLDHDGRLNVLEAS